MIRTDRPDSQGRRKGSGGPPLLLVAAISTALFIGSLAAGLGVAGQSFPSPFAEPALRSSYLAAAANHLQLTAFLQFGSAVPLAVLAASLFARLQHLGVRAAGPAIALVGGTMAAGFLALSAVLLWVLSRNAEPASMALALADLVFATGGPAHVVGLGLLVAGVAVPGLLLGLLPRWLAVAGIVIAVVAELSALALLWHPAIVLLPLARFPALVWLLGVARALPHDRRDVARRTGSSPQAEATA